MKKYAYLYIVSLVTFALPLSASAADVMLTATPTRVGVGDVVAVTVSVDTRTQLNTFSGVLTYDADILTPVSVSDGNSISDIWLTRPKVGATSTPFTGFAAGGFIGTGELFTQVFRVQKSGATNLDLSQVQFLRNDGQGTEEPVTVRALALALGSSSNGGYVEPGDSVSPESFSLSFGKDTAVFNGASYLAFAPVDKGSGIDRVEVGETRWPFGIPRLSTFESPYLIKDQYLTSRVVVRAYDRSGNIRTEVFPRKHLLRPYELGILGTLVVVLLSWLYFKKRSRA